MPRFFGPLPVAGDGSEENAFRPSVPPGVTGKIDDYVDWGAWYYPQNPPYQYCLITVYKVKKTLPIGVKKIELSLADCQSKYSQFFTSLKQSFQDKADPAPESWNFDSDTVGQVPTGWTVDAGTATVQNDQYVSSPNSFKFNTGGATGQHIAHAGASRTDLMVKAQTRVVTGDNWVMLLFRFVDLNNWYGLAYNEQIGQLRLRKRVAGTITDIASVSYTFNGATWYELKAEMQGQNARGYVNGVQVVPASGWQDMGSDFASGVIGVRTYCTLTTQNQWVDDVYVEDYGVTPITVSDSLSISDVVLAPDVSLPAIADSLVILDAVGIGTVEVAVNDVLSLLDEVGGEYTKNVDDSLSIYDAVGVAVEGVVVWMRAKLEDIFR